MKQGRVELGLCEKCSASWFPDCFWVPLPTCLAFAGTEIIIHTVMLMRPSIYDSIWGVDFFFF